MFSDRLVVTDYTFPDLNAEAAVAMACGLELDARKSKTEQDVVDAVSGAQAALVQFAPFGRLAIEAMRSPGVIVRYGVGYDNIDVPAALKAGHRVCYVPDYCVEEVADHTVAMALSLARRLTALDRNVRAGGWDAIETMRPLPSFSSQTAGFLGLGRIGRQVWARLRPFGFKGMVCDPAVSGAQSLDLGLEAADMDGLARGSDIIFLHLPASAQTRGIIDSAFFDKMKPGAMIVNCARGELVDEDALVHALQSGRIEGAALDVFRTEPLPAVHPLKDQPNVLLSPHAAWYSDNAISRLQSLAADEIKRFFVGEPARCPVPTAHLTR